MRTSLFRPSLALTYWTLATALVASARTLPPSPESHNVALNADGPDVVVGYYKPEYKWDCGYKGSPVTIDVEWIEKALQRSVASWNIDKSNKGGIPWGNGKNYPHGVGIEGIFNWKALHDDPECDASTKFVGTAPILGQPVKDAGKTDPGLYRALFSKNGDFISYEGVKHRMYHFCGVAKHVGNGGQYELCRELVPQKNIENPEQLVMS